MIAAVIAGCSSNDAPEVITSTTEQAYVTTTLPKLTTTTITTTTTEYLVTTTTLAAGDNQSVLTGSLHITSDPDGSFIYINGVPNGTTPRTISGLAPGNYTISLSKSGYRGNAMKKTVYAGNTTEVFIDLSKKR